ncbi:MAG: hypothetical protein ACOYNI_03820 [Acidimicrobiia bacterium]
MRRAGVAVIALVMIAGAIALRIIGAEQPLPALVVIAAAILLGETFELQPPGRIALPMSYAVFLVLGRVGTPLEAAITLASAELLAAVLRPFALRVRAEVFVWRCMVGAVGIGVYRLLVATTGLSSVRGLLVAFAVASLAMILAHEIGSALVFSMRSFSVRNRWPDLAVFTSGALMALGFGGVAGKGVMGAWSLAVFAIPLLATWYSFDRLASARTTYWQTIHALALAPEFAGLVDDGHTERVATLAAEVGRRLDLTFEELETLEAAAYLHHIGDLCVDVVSIDGEPMEPDPIAGVDLSVKILRDTGSLANVAEVVDAVSSTYRTPGSARPTLGGLSGAILKAASAFDDLAVGEQHGANRAMALLYSSPAYVYDPRVLGALENLLHRRGDPVPAA